MNEDEVPAKVQIVYALFSTRESLTDKEREEIKEVVNEYPGWFSDEIRTIANMSKID